MLKYREVLRLYAQNLSNRSIASSSGCSRNSVAEIISRANELQVSWPFDKDVNDEELQGILFPEKNKSDIRKRPDCEYIHREMARSGVTLSLLWHEYVEACRNRLEIPYSYRQYCRFYHRFATVSKATMRIKRKPGEIMEVDWAGQTMFIKDQITGEMIPAYIFVAALPCSQYAYVEAFQSVSSENWISAHIHAFRHFGGVTRMIVPDNLKTGVVKASSTDPIINRTYQEMAEHYHTVIMPARVRHPKDKASVEGTVGIISTWIIASLRNEQFFTVSELNKAILEKLAEFNQKDFQKKNGNRLSAFLEEEKFALLPLPASPYELANWKKETVSYDYHILAEKMFYSVPNEYIKHEVDIRITQKIIEVFFKNYRIASHMRLEGKEGKLSTLPEHMPIHHKQYLDFNRDYYLKWAKAIGPYTLAVVHSILDSYKVEKQALKSCMGLTKLADQYSIERVEKASKRALSYLPRPNLSSVKTILKTGQDKLHSNDRQPVTTTKEEVSSHGFTRGAAYYGRKEK
ncbi:IS21 family transposase [Paenisporosarcina sp. TG-14]|uniref:IS21 family transposase n=1 Tax=Paenisporosarcina sp. TG-14 TaxID=1231057 RepID=UPI000306460F|nr:IS21 family transposase [Paenisporosarcina sp. TG-14]